MDVEKNALAAIAGPSVEKHSSVAVGVVRERYSLVVVAMNETDLTYSCYYFAEILLLLLLFLTLLLRIPVSDYWDSWD